MLKKSEYNYVFEQAKKIVTTDFVLLYRKNNLGYARLGLALSKRIIGKAHNRNRIKRLLREAFRQTRLPAVDIIFLARPGVEQQAHLGINTNLSKTWKKLSTSYNN